MASDVIQPHCGLSTRTIRLELSTTRDEKILPAIVAAVNKAARTTR
jgi:hypothetical protein